VRVVFHLLSHEEVFGDSRGELLRGEGKVAPLQGNKAWADSSEEKGIIPPMPRLLVQ
jgi:hypothetical protein